jgi:hypothetical protein
MTDEQQKSLELTVARIDFNVTAMKEELLGSPNREGRIPRIEGTLQSHNDHDNIRFDKIFGQLNYWKGALALLGVAVTGIAAVLLAHILGGR